MNMKIAKQTEAPDFLEGVALETWNEIAPMLFRLGFLEETDTFCLAIYCETWAGWLEVHQQEDPDFDLMFKLTDTLMEYSDALGLNPAARLKIQRNLEICNDL